MSQQSQQPKSEFKNVEGGTYKGAMSTIPKEVPKQLSKQAFQELVRPMMPELLKRAVYLAFNSKVETVQLNAIKLLMNKVVPDLKSTKFEGELDMVFRNIVRLPEKTELPTPAEVVENE